MAPKTRPNGAQEGGRARWRTIQECDAPSSDPEAHFTGKERRPLAFDSFLAHGLAALIHGANLWPERLEFCRYRYSRGDELTFRVSSLRRCEMR